MSQEDWLDLLIEHEVAYNGMAAVCERTDCAWFLRAPGLPQYRDANRAVRLRTDGCNPDTVARDVVDYYRSHDLVPVADVDAVAEAMGIGAALRRHGLAEVSGDRILMRYNANVPPPSSRSAIRVEIVANETGRGEAAEWIETAVSDDIGWPDEGLWRAVASHEARYTSCRLYLGRLYARPAGTCDLFERARWGRIDSVVTHPELRRRGVATALVTRAVTDSLTTGNSQTYLFTEPGGNAERLYRSLGFTAWQLNPFRQYRG